MIMLPNGYALCVDTCFWNGDALDPERRGWTVTGEPPNLTMSPSVNIVGSYHGFVTNGVIGDDVEGRKFPNA